MGNILALYLTLKEIWRNKGRFIAIAAVVALITTLVLFIAALGEGLATGNIEYLSKLNADLIVYKENADLSVAASRISLSELNDIERLPGVKRAGPIGTSNAAIEFGSDLAELDVSLIGVEPGKPGEPLAYKGSNLRIEGTDQAIIGRNVAAETGLEVGDRFSLVTVQGTEETVHLLQIIGVSDGRQYFYQPSVFVPYEVWDRIRPKGTAAEDGSPVTNVVALQVADSTTPERVARTVAARLSDFQAVDRRTAYRSTPGFSSQQNTLLTQRIFSLVIGGLVVGGFFQIQTIQKIAQIGTLKAIGASNRLVAVAAVFQIMIVTVGGVALGGLGSWLLASFLPAPIPLRFTLESVTIALVSLILIGPLGGIVAVASALRVEPLTALGLGK